MWTKNEKKELTIFFVVTFGLTALAGILMGIHSFKNDGLESISKISGLQMLLPMTGVMAVIFLNRKQDKNVPRKFFTTFLIIVIIEFICCLLSVFFKGEIINGLLYFIEDTAITLGAIAGFLTYLLEDDKALSKYKVKITSTSLKNWIKYILLFLVLILFGFAMINIIQRITGVEERIIPSMNYLSVLVGFYVMVIRFFLQYWEFLGEEYGWRAFLQPLLQKRFGMRLGIIVLGIIWGLWHLPVSMFMFAPEMWRLQIFQQIFFCIALGTFMGYVYLKTENIWVIAMIHCLNNLIYAVLNTNVVNGFTNAGSIYYYLICIIVFLLCYCQFFKSKIFSDKKLADKIKL